MACLLGSFSIDESLERKNIRGLGWDFFLFFCEVNLLLHWRMVIFELHSILRNSGLNVMLRAKGGGSH